MSDDDDTETPRKRFKITGDMLAILVASFDADPLPDARKRHALAKALGMTQRSVQVWFQNRRQRQRPPLHVRSAGARPIGGGHCLTSPPKRVQGTNLHDAKNKFPNDSGGSMYISNQQLLHDSSTNTVNHMLPQGTTFGHHPMIMCVAPCGVLAPVAGYQTVNSMPTGSSTAMHANQLFTVPGSGPSEALPCAGTPDGLLMLLQCASSQSHGGCF